MASTHSRLDVTTERCENCGHETSHSVSIELRTENPDAANRKCSREPYRVTECRTCGATTRQRMNDA